jgi:aminoglycoside 6-adenylyltransferase
MDAITQAYEQVIERFVQWAAHEDDIRAAIIIGSRARVDDHPADEWADLDLMVVTKNPDRLINDSDWVAQLGVPILTFVEATAGGNEKERRVLFEGGLDVDFAIFPYARMQWVLSNPLTPELARDLSISLGRGLRMVVDKEGIFAQLEQILANLPAQAEPPPTADEFLHNIQDFWYHALWTAKHLRRGEIWWAKGGCDWRLKHLLSQMLQWHARATQGEQHDTWFRGRFLEQWADPRAISELRAVFAHYDEADIWRALFATMEVFRWLAVETAVRYAYSYPTAGDATVTELVNTLFSGRNSP